LGYRAVGIKSTVQRIFHGAGGLDFIRWQNRSRNRILTYHNFQSSGEEAFEQQCEHIRHAYNPVTLEQVTAFVRDGKTLPPNSVALTVDDGYRDFYLHAYPVLRRHQIPATVFLMTNFLDRIEWPWWDQLRYAFFKTTLDSVPLAIAKPDQVPLHDSASRERAFEKTAESLKLVPNTARLDFIAKLPETFKIEMPAHPPTGLEPMTWDEVREMAANGISFGAHTKSHPILGMISDDQLREEIEGSKQRLQDELGRAPVHFCYPNGRATDIGDRVRGAVEQAQFSAAVSTESGWNEPGSDPYMLKRLSMETGASKFYFRQQVAGFRI
jgi:peptidoglycan/xylan/chitin deacetylase (PgdA/CDA1 family)